MKGVYHINAVDIVTQWELVASVERVSEAYLLPLIALLLDGFPFAVRGFHSDSGSEYVNREMARLLDKLRVEFTRSRPRQTNDNALAECKNGAVIRKLMGYSHIPQKHATAINRFYTEVLNPYLNFHRPCYFAVDKVDAKGKIRSRSTTRSAHLGNGSSPSRSIRITLNPASLPRRSNSKPTP